ncbi:MAG: A/G-specific adenine glycosylase, partial [Sphingomonadales bacterium]
MPDNKPRAIHADLLDWYDRHARTLPWRAPPGANAPDPYRVWLSEIMLQQTQVASATPYFEKFTARWPDFAALAAADDMDLMAAWAGLGYYARARNLLACAREVATMGALPGTEAELRKLPGIGGYTAAAIAAIAFGQRAVVVDANVERVVSRLFAVEEPLPGARKRIHALTDTITPDARAGDFAQAMMDLGSGICTVRAPRCMLCPLRAACNGFASGAPERFSVKAAKTAKPQRYGTMFW